MTDKELLELAAKAAGIESVGTFGEMLEIKGVFRDGRTYIDEWNPLTDNGDCFRLETARGLSLKWNYSDGWVKSYNHSGAYTEFFADHNGDKDKARRYASTRAAGMGLASRRNR
jgi:hypothetical protein